MSLRCPKCMHEFSVLDQPCRKCDGKKLEEKTDKNGKVSTIPCARCNGRGTEQAHQIRKGDKRGKGAEMKAAKTFQEWWLKPDGTQYEWRRTPQSGGSVLAAGWDMAGDVCTNATDWPFHIECKRTKSFSLDQLLTVPETAAALGEYIEQALGDAPVGKIPMLFLQNPGPSQPTFVMLLDKQERWPPHFRLGMRTGMWHGTYYSKEAPIPYVIMVLKTFLAQGVEGWRPVYCNA